jgi:enoyl-CoA hydratase/carnithine racemase
MSADHILLVDEAAPGIRVLTLNRPEKRNALSLALLAAVAEQCNAAAIDTSIRCVVIAATGPAFCAGVDIAEMRDGGSTPCASPNVNDIGLRSSGARSP